MGGVSRSQRSTARWFGVNPLLVALLILIAVAPPSPLSPPTPAFAELTAGNIRAFGYISDQDVPGGFRGVAAEVWTPHIWLYPGAGQAAGPTAIGGLNSPPYIESGPTRDCRDGKDCGYHPYASWLPLSGVGEQNTDTSVLVPLEYHWYWSKWEPAGGNQNFWKALWLDPNGVWRTLAWQDLGTSSPMRYASSGGEGACQDRTCPFGQIRTRNNQYYDASENPHPWDFLWKQIDADGATVEPTCGSYCWDAKYDPRYFLPYLRRQWDGSYSQVAVQNPSNASANVRLDVFDWDGTYRYGSSQTLNTSGSTLFDLGANLGFATFDGFGVVRSTSSKVTVMAKVQYPTNASGYTAYKAWAGSNDAIRGSGWPASNMLLPMVKKAWYGHTSYLEVLNVEAVPVNVSIDFRHAQGDPAVYGQDLIGYTGQLGPLGPGQRRRYNLGDIGLTPGAGGRWLGSAKVNSTPANPSPPPLTSAYLAVLASDTADDGSQDERFNSFSPAGAITWADVPLVKNGWWGGTTGIVVMNVDDLSAANVSLTYYACYESGGNTDCATEYPMPSVSIDPLRSYFWYYPSGLPPNFLGSAIARSTNGVLIVGLSQENYTTSKGTEGRAATVCCGRAAAAVPVYMTNAYNQGQTWQSGIQIQNTGGTDITSLDVLFYDQNGALAFTFHLPDAYPSGLGPANPLRPGRSVNYYNLPGMSGFVGSARIRVNGSMDRIGVTSNLNSNANSGSADAFFGFNGYERNE
ncbi:MAG: hypothetical protein HY331_12705 [Chloroflexi bacterium]|nr:hypothetical protein [Chloroflexota bacterium]